MKNILIASLAILVATSAPAAAGTKLSGSLVPTPPDCFSGPDFCKNGLPQTVACGFDNSGCEGGTLLKGKLYFSDHLLVKLSVSGLLDNDGTPVSTLPGNQMDDHILRLSFNQCITETGTPSTCNTPVDVYVKVDLENGKAKVSADLSQALNDGGTGTALWLTSASLQAYAADSFACTGGNDAAEIAARNSNGNCNSGTPYAVFGVQQP